MIEFSKNFYRKIKNFPLPLEFTEELPKKFQKNGTILLLPINIFIGIEIEVENITKETYDFFLLPELKKIWAMKDDGSLRNSGIEFVSIPLYPKILDGYLAHLLLHLIEKKAKFSWRTSYHVHMDITQQTHEFILKLVLVYCIFEDLLFDFAGNGRKNGVYCIPFHDSEAIEVFREELLKQKLAFLRNDIYIYWNKYSALNLRPIVSQGTVEFRHMQGTNDILKVTGWINILLELYNYCNNESLERIIEIIKSINTTSTYDAFLKMVFPHSHMYLMCNDYFKKMSKGTSIAKFILNTSRVSPKILKLDSIISF